MKALRFILLLVIIGAIVFFIVGGNKKQNLDTTQSQTFVFVDENETAVSAEFFEDGVQVTLPDGRVYNLNQAISASGARYANEDESFVFWNSGNEVTIYENDEITFSGSVAVQELENERTDQDTENDRSETNLRNEEVSLVDNDVADVEADPSVVQGSHIGTWRWVETVYAAASTGLPPQPRSNVFTLTLTTDGTVSGTTDCNGFGGAYLITDNNGIDFGDEFWSTLMYCEGSQEAEFTGLLMRADSIHQPAMTALILNLENQSGQIIFERV